MFGRALVLGFFFVLGAPLVGVVRALWPSGPLVLVVPFALALAGAVPGLFRWIGEPPRAEDVLRNAGVGGTLVGACLGGYSLFDRVGSLFDPSPLFWGVVLVWAGGLVAGVAVLAYASFSAGMWGSSALVAYLSRPARGRA